MAGLLDEIFGTDPSGPKAQAMIALQRGLMSNNPAMGFADANQAFAQAPDMALQRQLKQMQLAEMQSQLAQRQMSMQNAREEQAWTNKLLSGQLGGGGAQGTGGAMPTGSSSAGGVGVGSGGSLPVGSSSRSFLSSLNEDQVLGLIKAGKLPAGTEKLWELSKFGKDYKQGDFRLMPNGESSMVPMVKEGIGYGPNGVNVLPGAAESQQQLTLANELAKAAAASAGRVNLRDNADGTKSPVPELTENPLLQKFLGRGAPQGRMQPQAQMQPTSMSPQAGMTGAFKGNVEDIVNQINQIGDPQERANAMSALMEQARRTPDFAQNGFSGGDIPAQQAPGAGYGQTTAQQIANDAAKAKAVKQAESDVKPTDQRSNDLAGSNYMLSVINQTLGHPGLPVGTGLQGKLDPRNYVAGTDAKGFQALMDQIKGGTFMQAYTNLKGGGQITEVEGTKAENAIARLNTSQSTEDVTKALRELKEVITAGANRQKSSNQRAGAPNSFPGDNANMVGTPLPKNLTASSLQVGQAYTLPNGKTGTWNGLTFTVK